ncbi:MAG TPA: hypothetical protein VFO90_08685 [Terrimicrobiaceae bacterium]|nr:hypothetical protein [Terrimicrobiaceae bacterium]
MNRDTLLSLYQRLTALVEKLPGGLQKPILRELVPIRELFLEQRPARIVLLGETGMSVPEFLHSVAGVLVETGGSDHGWRSYRIPERGEIFVLDARLDTPQEVFDYALTRFVPDAALLLRQSPVDQAAFDLAAERISVCPTETPVVAIPLGDDSSRARLAALLKGEREFSKRQVTICAPEAGESVAEAVAAVLPNIARLEFARLTGAKGAQAQIAGSLLKSFTAVCGVIGLQPIPLADMPVLTALQTLMVALIIHTAGKPFSARIVGEFLGALGLNIGAGILFREGARAIIKVVPVWGNAVSGMVAGAGTYAVGRAAIAYFIEDIPLSESKKLFQRLLPGWDAFKRRRLPELPQGGKDDSSAKR